MGKRELFSNLVITNPKRYTSSSKTSDECLFPYYAGYSKEFAEQLLSTLSLGSSSVVLDPWNGGGTTTQAASQMGLTSVGLDLNPVMVIVAKAALLPQHEVSSLIPLAQSLVEQAVARDDHGIVEDPLCEWLLPESTRFIRQLDSEINRTLVSHGRYVPLTTEKTLNQISALNAFFYVALFRAVRHLLKSFIPTNPTWIKRPAHSHQRKRPSRHVVHDIFIDEVRRLTQHLNRPRNSSVGENGAATISLGNAEALSLPNASIDAIITSPPYCTRIDYAVATAIELSILRLNEELFNQLRRSLMGTSTVNAKAGSINQQWGATCARFLDAVYEHPSKASQGYYYKNHYQYFESLQSSITELTRVLKSQGSCILVVQDSYYKDIHNDVPTIATEMAKHAGMALRRREDFASNRSMVSMNQRAKKYLLSRKTVESVLCFERT